MTNRRNFIKKSTFLTASSLLTAKSIYAKTTDLTNKLQTKPSKKIGLQIYSVRNELPKDVPGGLKKIGQMGYTTIELAGYKQGKIGDIDMMVFKKMAEDAGLKIVSSHVNPPLREYTKGNKAEIANFWKKATEDHVKLGVTYLIQPGQPSTRSIEEVSFVCEVFNEAGQIAKDSGLQFGYHNHEYEFAKVVAGGNESFFGRKKIPDSEIIYDLFLKQTDPSLVFFELDVYWAVMGQNDPVEYMKNYPERIRVLHIKDKQVLGKSGMMNFENIFSQAYANNIKDFFVELEGINEASQFEGVKDCAEYLTKASFVR